MLAKFEPCQKSFPPRVKKYVLSRLYVLSYVPIRFYGNLDSFFVEDCLLKYYLGFSFDCIPNETVSNETIFSVASRHKAD